MVELELLKDGLTSAWCMLSDSVWRFCVCKFSTAQTTQSYE